MWEKNYSYSQGLYEGDNGLLQVYADDSVFCEYCLYNQADSGKMKTKDKINILHDITYWTTETKKLC